MDERPYADPAMVGSNFDRNVNDAYWTEPWVTRALLSALEREGIGSHLTRVWEPACGRGDMVRVLRDAGYYDVISTDIDLSSYREGLAGQQDFLKATALPEGVSKAVRECRAIITNPPYHRVPGARTYMTDLFVQHALAFDVAVVAMLMRSSWKSAGSRRSLFEQRSFKKRFHMEVVLTDRPRWDDWENEPKPKNAPRHDYSWYVWLDDDTYARSQSPTILWESKS